jgi:hypothetical protein
LPAPRARRVLVGVSLASVIFGGVLMWSLWFAGLGSASLAVGAAATLIPILAYAWRDPIRRRLTFMLGFAFAFVVLTWPILWLVVGYVNYLLTGETPGD